MSTQKKGDMIFWEVNDIETTKEALAKLGFDKFVPRNDYRSALIKAIKKLVKGDDKLYRRYGEGEGTCKFGIFGQTVDADELQLNREIGIILDKTTGELSPVRPEDVESRLFAMIQEEYKAASKTLDSNQFRQLVLRIVREDGVAVAMRSGGGIYFVDERFAPVMDKLEKLFNGFPQSAKLSRVPIYNDPGTNEALSFAISQDLQGDIATLIADIEKRYKDGTITKRQLESDMQKAQDIIERYKVHSENLAARSVAIKAKLNTVSKTLKHCKERVESGIVSASDFSSSLESL